MDTPAFLADRFTISLWCQLHGLLADPPAATCHDTGGYGLYQPSFLPLAISIMVGVIIFQHKSHQQIYHRQRTIKLLSI